MGIFVYILSSSEVMESTISLLKICFSICLALTIVFFIIAVVLFFVFDIRTIFNIRTGRAKRKTVQEMQEANSRTGRLRVDGKTQTAQLRKENKPRKGQPVIQPPTKSNAYLRNNVTEDVREASRQYEERQRPYDDEASTRELEETAMLNQSPYDTRQTELLTERKVKFNITKKVVIVHTKEIVT